MHVPLCIRDVNWSNLIWFMARNHFELHIVLDSTMYTRIFVGVCKSQFHLENCSEKLRFLVHRMQRNLFETLFFICIREFFSLFLMVVTRIINHRGTNGNIFWESWEGWETEPSNRKDVRESEKPQASSTDIVKESSFTCCQGTNGISCLTDQNNSRKQPGINESGRRKGEGSL